VKQNRLNAICKAFHGQAVLFTIFFISLDRYEEVIRLQSIKTSLEKTLRKPEDTEGGQSNAEFDYSLAAVCEVPKHINLSEWFEQKTWNILFKPNYKQYNVKSVFLR
jgi:hypothetical protein